MGSGYDAKSCSVQGKPFYFPIEAAIRWCNLLDHELEIMQKLDGNTLPPLGMFPQWPCLRANAEIIYDALDHGELPCGRDGKTVNEHVSYARRTVRHSDLKIWMEKYRPDQKPAFLFDEIERSTHTAINADSFRALQADRDALQARLDKAKEVYKALKSDRDAIVVERDALLAKAGDGKPLATTERNTLLVLIAALCKQAKIDYKERGISGAIVKATEEVGAPVTDDTIRKILNQISDALESRSK
jgi:hypothetical protein